MHRILAVLICLAACATPPPAAYSNWGAGARPCGGTDDTGPPRTGRVAGAGEVFELPAPPATALHCVVPASSTANALCAAAPDAGSLYVTDVEFTAGASALSLSLEYGASTNCDAGVPDGAPTALTVAAAVGANSSFARSLDVPLQVPAGNSLCCFTSGSMAYGCEVDGYVK